MKKKKRSIPKTEAPLVVDVAPVSHPQYQVPELRGSQECSYHSLTFVAKDGLIVTIITDKPMPLFDGRYLAAHVESREAYRMRVMREESIGSER